MLRETGVDCHSEDGELVMKEECSGDGSQGKRDLEYHETLQQVGHQVAIVHVTIEEDALFRGRLVKATVGGHGHRGA